jgi:hypothetical protein
MSLKKKIIIIIISVIVVTCAAIAITLYVIDSNNQLREEQLISNVLESIAEHDRLFNNTDDREYKVVLFNGLTDFSYAFVDGDVPPYHVKVRELNHEIVIADFNKSLSSMEDWFYNYYLSAIGIVETKAVYNLVSRNDFLEDVLADIDSAHIGFLAAVESVVADSDTEPTRISLIASQQYNDFLVSMAQFDSDSFISDRVSDAETLITDLENIKLQITLDGVITDMVRLQEFENRINSLIDELYLQLDDNDTVSTSNQFITVSEFMLSWLMSHYGDIFNEISKREKANQNDSDTVNQQIADLAELKTLLVEDGAIGFTLNAQIDELIVELNADLEAINERLEAERRARETAERTRRQQSGGGSTGGGSTGGGASDGGGTSGGGSTGGGGTPELEPTVRDSPCPSCLSISIWGVWYCFC